MEQEKKIATRQRDFCANFTKEIPVSVGVGMRSYSMNIDT